MSVTDELPANLRGSEEIDLYADAVETGGRCEVA